MILGVQLLTTLIVGLFMTKIFSKYSWGLIIFRNLSFLVPPTTQYLGSFSQSYKEHMKRKPRNGETKQPPDDFLLPKASELELRSNTVTTYQHISLMTHSEDIDMILLLSLSTLIIYLVTEIYNSLVPSNYSELHLSYIWSVIIIFFCVKFLLYMVVVYLQLNGERALCGLSGFFLLVIALIASMTSEDVLDFGLAKGYNDMILECRKFSNNSGVKTDLQFLSVKGYRGVLAVISAILGTLITFPSIRLGQLNARLMNSPSAWVQLLTHFNMLTPLLLAFSWVRPVVKEHFMSQVNISEFGFQCIQIWLVLTMLLVRLLTIKLYTQSHLDTAQDFMANMHREAGKISYKHIQAKISYTFQYSGVVVLQILTPAIILCQICLIFYSLHVIPSSLPPPTSPRASHVIPSFNEMTSSIRGIFPRSFLTSLLNYFLWWILSCSTGISLLASGYNHLTSSA